MNVITLRENIPVHNIVHFPALLNKALWGALRERGLGGVLTECLNPAGYKIGKVPTAVEYSINASGLR